MSATDSSPLVIVRYSGELSTKARETRRRFLTLLLRNLREALRSSGIESPIERFHERAFIRSGGTRSLEVASRVFGVQSAALGMPFSVGALDETVARCREFFAPLVRGKRFAARAKIVGSRRDVSWSSVEFERALGAALLPIASGVDLSRPEVVAGVEVHRDRGFAITETRAGPAGLPIGSEGRALVLLSGGYDSAAAAWQLMRRGVRPDYFFCTLGGEEHARGALRVAQVLQERWAHGSDPKFVLLEFDAIVEKLREHTRPRYWQILLKRFMFAAADAVAREQKIDVLATGEAIGQVSSQTVRNLAVIEEVTSRPVLRPLAGMNKDDIIALTRRIGTADISDKVQEHCSLDASEPTTGARSAVAAEYEAGLPPGLLEEALEGAQVLRVRDFHATDADDSAFCATEPAAGTTVLDVRPRPLYDAHHIPGALSLPWDQALRGYASFDVAQRYTVCCEYGFLSAELARRMRAKGFSCVHLSGGMRRHRKRHGER